MIEAKQFLELLGTLCSLEAFHFKQEKNAENNGTEFPCVLAESNHWKDLQEFIFIADATQPRTLQTLVTSYTLYLFPWLLHVYCMHYQHGVCLHVSDRLVKLMPSYAGLTSVAFPKTCLHFKNCCITLEPSCLGKCSLHALSQHIVATQKDYRLCSQKQ